MFKSMHQTEKPLLICNVWDIPSAQIAEQAGFAALGTSSAAISRNLGKQDGENIAFEDLVLIVEAIVQSTTLPVTVDIESGFGSTPETIANNVMKLAGLGVVGINIEDSIVEQGKRRLRDGAMFAELLREVKAILAEAKEEVFINVRSDAFLLNVNDPLSVSLERIGHYQQAGADGIFLPCIRQKDDIQAVVASTSLPINVMCVPELACFQELSQLGVKRISMGNFVHEAMLAYLSTQFVDIEREQSFDVLFRGA